MRQRILVIIVLLSALLLSGWGSVIAAAFCAHDAAQRSLMAAEHDCCRARLEAAHEHCEASAPSSHEAMAMDEMEATPVAAKPLTDAFAVVLNQLDEACVHCLSRRELPTAFATLRPPEQKKRDANNVPPPALKVLVSPIAHFAPALLARQNAPPKLAARRHLLLGVLVI